MMILKIFQILNKEIGNDFEEDSELVTNTKVTYYPYFFDNLF